MTQERKNVLIIAYACEPEKTSEPGVGWHFSQEISKYFNTTVLTRENNKNVIEKAGENNIRFLYYDLHNIFKIFKKKIPFGTQLYYILWQWGAYLYAKKHIDNSHSSISLVHHLTFGISWIAPPVFLLKTPFVWGPIGGGDFVPEHFLKGMDFKSRFQEILYFVLNKINRMSLFSFLARKKANIILFRTQSSIKAFPENGCIRRVVVSETASSYIGGKGEKEHSNYIHALCVGRMAYWKGFMMAVKGFHLFFQMGGVGKLELFGEGPEIKSIKQYIKDNHLEEAIIVRGFVKNDLIKSKLEETTVLLHPSFRDGGSWSVMEAMSFGLPVICLNTSGPKDMVTEECGLLVDMISPVQVVEDIAKGLHKLAENSEFYKMLSINARKRIKNEYNWVKRGEQLKDIYTDVLQEWRDK